MKETKKVNVLYVHKEQSGYNSNGTTIAHFCVAGTGTHNIINGDGGSGQHGEQGNDEKSQYFF